MHLPFSCYIQHLNVVSADNCYVGLQEENYRVVFDEICRRAVDSQRVLEVVDSVATSELVVDSLVEEHYRQDSFHGDGLVEILENDADFAARSDVHSEVVEC